MTEIVATTDSLMVTIDCNVAAHANSLKINLPYFGILSNCFECRKYLIISSYLT